MAVTDVIAVDRLAYEQLRTSLDELTAITAEDLAQADRLGTELNFSDGIPIFDRTLRLFRTLKDTKLDSVPANPLGSLKNQTDNALTAFRAIKEFTTNQANPANVRDTLIEQVAQSYHQHFAVLSPVIAYATQRGTDFEKLGNEARAALGKVQEIVTDADTRLRKAVADAELGLERIRQAASEAGVAQQAIYFRDEASAHRKARRVWLWVTAGMAVVLLAFAVVNAWYYLTNPVAFSTAQGIQIALSKLVVFGVLYFAVVWSGRIYRAESHNYVVNRHRQNALSSFETFVTAAGDDQTKNAVLLQATHSIFQHQVSGFASQEADGPSSPQVLEIIRGSLAQPKTPSV